MRNNRLVKANNKKIRRQGIPRGIGRASHAQKVYLRKPIDHASRKIGKKNSARPR